MKNTYSDIKNFQKSYTYLFNAITDIIEEMEIEENASEVLKKYIGKLKNSQINAEEIYISQ